MAAKQAGGARLGNLRNLGAAGAIGRRVQAAEADRFAANILPVVAEIRRSGVSGLASIADALNRRGIRTVRGHDWQVSSVRNLLARSEQLPPISSTKKRLQPTEKGWPAANSYRRSQADLPRLC